VFDRFNSLPTNAIFTIEPTGEIGLKVSARIALFRHARGTLSISPVTDNPRVMFHKNAILYVNHDGCVIDNLAVHVGHK